MREPFASERATRTASGLRIAILVLATLLAFSAHAA